MRSKILLCTAFLLTLPGCFGAEALQQVSTGYTGCSADEISITNDSTAIFNQRAWDASCRGRTYHCSAVNKGGVSCTEDRATAAVVTAQSVPREQARTAARAPLHLWQRFVAKDCGVALDLPGEPEERRPAARSTNPTGAYSASVDIDDGLVAVRCQARPKGADDDRALDVARDMALQEIGAAFTSEFDVEGPNVHGRETQFVAGGEHGRMRLLLRGGQVVTLILSPTRAFSKQEASRFFQSVTDAPAVAPVAAKSSP